MSLIALRRLPLRFSSPRIGFLGTGVQAKAHLEAFASHFQKLGTLTTYTPTGRSFESFRTFAGDLLPTTPCVQSHDVHALIENSDIVVSSIPAGAELPHPSLEKLRRGAFATLPDLGRNWIPQSHGEQHILITDSFEQSQELMRAKKMQLTSSFDWDLRKLLSEHPSLSVDKSYVFAFGGLGLCDALLATHCLELAERNNLGVAVQF